MENSLANKKPWLVAEWSERNGSISPDDVPYGSKKLYWWHGSCGHEWQASVKARSSGENCRFAVTPESLRVSMTLRV